MVDRGTPFVRDVTSPCRYMLTLCSAMEDLARNESEAVQVQSVERGGGYHEECGMKQP